MHKTQDYYPHCPEAMIVSLARTGDRSAFAELVRRRQFSIRNLMRRCCSDNTLADDLAQQVFMKVWLNIHTLKQVNAFSAWLKRLAVSVWLQHLVKRTPFAVPMNSSSSNLRSTIQPASEWIWTAPWRHFQTRFGYALSFPITKA